MAAAAILKNRKSRGWLVVLLMLTMMLTIAPSENGLFDDVTQVIAQST